MTEPNLSALLQTKPIGLPDDIWIRLKTDSLKAEFVENYPHPPVVGTYACAGNEKRGNPKNHVFQVVGLEYYWDKTSYEWGLWQARQHNLTGWIEPSQVPQSIEFLGNQMSVVFNPNAHGVCPKCK